VKVSCLLSLILGSLRALVFSRALESSIKVPLVDPLTVPILNLLDAGLFTLVHGARMSEKFCTTNVI